MTVFRQPSPSAALQAANARLLSLRAEMTRQRQQAVDLAAEPDLPTPHRHDPNIDMPHTQDSDTHNSDTHNSDTHNQEIPKLDFHKAAAYRANIQDRLAPTALSTAPAEAPGKVPYTAQSALKYASTTSPLDSLIHHLPTHLGWYSASVTSQLRRRLPSDHTVPSYNALNRNARETAVSAEPALSLSKCSVQAVCKTIANSNVLMPLRNLSYVCDTLIPKGRETATSAGSVQAVSQAFGIRDMLPLLCWSRLLGKSVSLPISLETATSTGSVPAVFQTFANGSAPMLLLNLSSVCDTHIPKGRETAVSPSSASAIITISQFRTSPVSVAVIRIVRKTAVLPTYGIGSSTDSPCWFSLMGKLAAIPIGLETAVSPTSASASTIISQFRTSPIGVAGIRVARETAVLPPSGIGSMMTPPSWTSLVNAPIGGQSIRETAVFSTSCKAATIMPLSCIAPSGVTTGRKARETAVLPSPYTSLPPVSKKPETAVLPPVGSYASAPADTRRHPQAETMIKLQPSLALAMLRSGQTATGRLWLLLRYLDENGRGWLELADVRARLTKKGSPTRLCGQRQLRALLQQGNDLFWQRDKTRVWLSATAKVAAGLGVGRLQGNPIALPLAVLLEPIGLVRAHLYASFHSSRTSQSGQSAPISRASLTAVSGVSQRTQHAYERRAGVMVRPNIAIGDTLSQHNAQTAAWHHGRAAFVFTDKLGKQGKPGRQYLAWRLPNSYSGPHTRLGRGRQRQLNRQLVDLRNDGDAGNGHFGRLGAGCLAEMWRWRRYTTNGVFATRCQKQAPAAWVYGCGRGGHGVAFWVVLSAGARPG